MIIQASLWPLDTECTEKKAVNQWIRTIYKLQLDLQIESKGVWKHFCKIIYYGLEYSSQIPSLKHLCYIMVYPTMVNV